MSMFLHYGFVNCNLPTSRAYLYGLGILVQVALFNKALYH